MNALSLLTAFLTLHGAAAQKNLSMDVYRVTGGNRVLVKSGDNLTGEIQFRAIIQTDHPIQTVEFYVGDDLRESDGSTPYEFKLDTLTEEDGTIKLRFKGFTSEGQNVEKVFSLKVDNGVSKGADFHVADQRSNGSGYRRWRHGRGRGESGPRSRPSRARGEAKRCAACAGRSDGLR